MMTSNCISYSDVLDSEFHAIRVGDPLSHGLLDFGRERHTEPAGGESTGRKLSLTNPVIDYVRCDAKPGCDFLDAHLARSQQSWRIDPVGIAHPTHSSSIEAPSGSSLEVGTVEVGGPLSVGPPWAEPSGKFDRILRRSSHLPSRMGSLRQQLLGRP